VIELVGSMMDALPSVGHAAPKNRWGISESRAKREGFRSRAAARRTADAD
jgi:hypothetical protein